MLRRAFLGFSAILAVTILFGGAFADENDKQVKGIFVKADLKASTLTVKTLPDKIDKTYDINDKTKFMRPQVCEASAMPA